MAEESKQEVQEQGMDYNFMDLSNLSDVSEIEGFEFGAQTQDEDEDKPQETQDRQDSVNSEEKSEEDSEETTEVPASLEKDKKEPSPFTPYAKLVQDAGLLPNFDVDSWDGTPEGLIQGMQAEIESGVNSYKETLNPQIKWLADNYEEGVPLEQLLQIDKERYNLNSINEEALAQEDTQKNIVKQYYKETTRFSDATIDKAIERLEATGDLEDESKTFFEELKELNIQKEGYLREQAKEQQLQQTQQRQEQLTKFKQKIDTTEEIVPGVKLNAAIKDKVYKGLTTAVDVNPTTGQPMNEIQKSFMQNPELETTFAYLWYATNGFKDFKVFGSTGKKSAVQEFENAVQGMDFNQGTQQRISKPGSDPDLVAQMQQISQQWGT